MLVYGTPGIPLFSRAMIMTPHDTRARNTQQGQFNSKIKTNLFVEGGGCYVSSNYCEWLPNNKINETHSKLSHLKSLSMYFNFIDSKQETIRKSFPQNLVASDGLPGYLLFPVVFSGSVGYLRATHCQ